MEARVFKELLIENPIIAAVRDEESLNNVIKSKALIVFILYGNIMNIGECCRKLIDAGKKVFIHVDMIEGLRADKAGIEFIKIYANPCGILSTKPSNIKFANQLQMYTIQRIFAIDTHSLKTGVKSIHETCPNAVEIMPGIASMIIKLIQKDVKVPIIASGLIDSKKDVMQSISAGAIAISTSSKELWEL